MEDPVKGLKWQATNWEKIFSNNITSNSELAVRTHEEYLLFNYKKASNPIKNEEKI